MLIVTTVAGWVWMIPTEFEEYSRTLAAVVLFASNIYFWRVDDYFAPAAQVTPLLHTWSLAVEEQFYIVFPLMLLAAWRFARLRLLWILLGLSIVSLMMAEWWTHSRNARFYLPVTRAWELGAGSICALILRRFTPRANSLLAGLGLALIAYAVFVFDARTPFPSVYALVPVGGATLVVLYGGTGTLAARLLAVPVLVRIGLISYSAYLWHQPLFALARIRNVAYSSPELMLGLSLATLGLAYLSWRFVEQPFRGRPGTTVLLSRQSLFAASAVGIAALFGVGLYGQLTDGHRDAWARANPVGAPVLRLYEAAEPLSRAYMHDGACQFNVQALSPTTIARLRSCRQSHGAGVAIVGDSHAMDFFNGMNALGNKRFIFGMTRARDFGLFGSLLRDQPGLFRLVVFHEAGWRFFKFPGGLTGKELFDQTPESGKVSTVEFRLLPERIAQDIDLLAGLSKLTNLIWVGPRIEPHIRLNAMVDGGCNKRFALRDGQVALFTNLDKRLGRAAAEGGVHYVSLIDAIQFDMATDFMTCSMLFWRDGDHWSTAGARLFVQRLLTAKLSNGDGVGTGQELRLAPLRQAAQVSGGETHLRAN